MRMRILSIMGSRPRSELRRRVRRRMADVEMEEVVKEVDKKVEGRGGRE